MRKTLVTMVLCLCALLGAQAQTIQNGSKWWDGSVLYTATVDNQFSVVYMNGVGPHEGGFKFQLSKVLNKAGEYVLSADAPDVILPVRGQLGWQVNYIRQEGMNFLAIRKPNGDVCHTLVLTPDNLENCVAQEKFAENEPVSDVIMNMLLNTTYLSQFSKPELRLLRNEILARNGWKFQSQDLRDRFEAQPWYRPVANNNTVKLNIIEQTNVQLIKSEESVPDDERGYRDFSTGPENNSQLRALVNGQEGDFPGGLAEDGRGPDEINGEQVWTVTTETEFLAALGNNRTVLIGDDVHLNLSRILENERYFKNLPGRRWTSDASAIVSKEPLVVSESEVDGRQMTLVNMSQLTIKGGKNASIEVDPRYSYCLYFVNCDHCEVQNLTIGHTELGTCSGGVIGVKGGRQNVVKDCDLYGCGTYGLDLIETTDFGILNSNIHDCTYGIIQMRSSVAVKFTNCDFFNNREYGLIESWGCEGVSFMGCRIFANWGDAKLFNLDNTFYMAGCEIYHPTQNLGTIDMADQSGKKNKFSENPLDKNIKSRNLGPK